jgi:hypothetical protein
MNVVQQSSLCQRMRVAFSASTLQQNPFSNLGIRVIDYQMWYGVPASSTAKRIRSGVISLSRANYDLWVGRISLNIL